MTGFDLGALASWEENMTALSERDRMKLVVMEIMK
jgi:hypothetical protein